MINKEFLDQYIDIKKEISEIRFKVKKLEYQIDQIEEQGAVVDSVSGGEGGTRHFKIEGFPYPEYRKKKNLLYQRLFNLQILEKELLEKTNEIETFIASIEDSRVRRIINLRFIEDLSWRCVAQKLGGGNTEECVKKTFYRFMEIKNESCPKCPKK